MQFEGIAILDSFERFDGQPFCRSGKIQTQRQCDEEVESQAWEAGDSFHRDCDFESYVDRPVPQWEAIETIFTKVGLGIL